MERIVQIQENGALKELRTDTMDDDVPLRTWSSLEAWSFALMEEGTLGYITMIPPPDHIVIPIRMDTLPLPEMPVRGLRGLLSALRGLFL